MLNESIHVWDCASFASVIFFFHCLICADITQVQNAFICEIQCLSLSWSILILCYKRTLLRQP